MFAEVKLITTLEGATNVELYQAIGAKTQLQDLSVSVLVFAV